MRVFQASVKMGLIGALVGSRVLISLKIKRYPLKFWEEEAEPRGKRMGKIAYKTFLPKKSSGPLKSQKKSGILRVFSSIFGFIEAQNFFLE